MSPRRSLPLLALALLSVGGCNRGDQGAPLVAVIGDKLPDLGDPLRPTASEAQAVLRLATAQGLVRFDSTGQIEPGLAERWNVSDDGLSYIFRLATGEWPGGRKIVAKDVARLVQRQIAANRDSATRDAVGVIEEVVAMTDRVVEIRLRAPRPNLLSLLAQPDFALIVGGAGSGPFTPLPDRAGKVIDEGGALRLRRRIPGTDGEPGEREDVRLSAMPAAKAIGAFVDDKAALVLGGTFDDLPLANAAKLPRGALVFDPVSGLFGLIPARGDGPYAKAEVRRILSQAIDRGALINRLGVPRLGPRATVLEGGLYGLAAPAQPIWLNQPIESRRAALGIGLRRLLDFKEDEPLPTVRVAMPQGHGGDLLLARLTADWGALGLTVERVAPAGRADFRFVDEVAPSDSPAWFVRHFRCAVAPICSKEADVLLDQAREAPVPAERAILLGRAAALMDEQQLFLPIAAPIRWSLVSRAMAGFVANRYARHPLVGLEDRSGTGSDQ